MLGFQTICIKRKSYLIPMRFTRTRKVVNCEIGDVCNLYVIIFVLTIPRWKTFFIESQEGPLMLTQGWLFTFSGCPFILAGPDKRISQVGAR